MMLKPNVSACIVTYNNCVQACDAIASLLENTKLCDLSLYISDNGSTDEIKRSIEKKFSTVNFVDNVNNIGFGKGHNIVINMLTSKYHAVVNPDIIINDEVLFALCSYLDENPDVVMVTPKILNKDGTEQHLPKLKPRFKYLLSGRVNSLKKWRDEYTMAKESLLHPTEIDFCTGCFFVIRTDVFKQLSGFDDRFFMYFEDADLTLRAKKYGKIVFLPSCSVTHLWQRESGKSLTYLFIHISSMLKFFLKNLFNRGEYK